MKTRLMMGIVGALVVVSFLVARPVHAGIISLDAELRPKGKPKSSGPPDFVWEKLPDRALAVLSELFDRDTGDGLDAVISGIATTSDPVISLTKEITNFTDIAWIGFNIDLDPAGAATFVGTASSDKMTLVSQTDHSLVFGLPSVVAAGEDVSFSMDISVLAGGPFSFTLAQAPVLIPEPTTMALFSLAVAFVSALRRRRTR